MDRGPGEWDAEEPAREGTMSVKKSEGFTAEERAAMRERAKELKAEAQRADGERAVLTKIAEMPAYAKEGKVVCFFQSAEKFNARYATFGFSDKANLDEGAMWPTSFALKELTAAAEARIGALVKRAAV